MYLKKFLAFLLLLIIRNSIDCVELENICEDEIFLYNDYEVVNSVHKVSFNRTYGPISNLLVDENEEFENMFNNQYHRFKVLEIRSLYNQVIRQVFIEYLTNLLEEQRLVPYRGKVYDYLNRINNLGMVVKEDQKEKFMNLTYETIEKGQKFINDLIDCVSFNGIGYNKNSIEKINLIIESLKLDDKQKLVLNKHDNSRILMFNKFDKLTGTIDADIYIPINNANWNNENNCLHLEQLPKFYADFWKLDPRNKNKF